MGRAVGVVDDGRIEIGDMHSQAAERERWLAQLHAAAQARRARSASSPSRRAREPRHPPQRRRRDRDRGWADDEPLGRPDPRGDHRRERGARDRPPEQPERALRGGERRGGVDEGRARDRDRLGAGGDRGRVRVRRVASADENEAAMREAIDAVTAARSRAPRATPRSTGSPPPRATSSRSSTARPSRPTRACGSCSTHCSTGSRAMGLSYVQLIRGDGAPEEDELRERLPRAGSRPTSAGAASRTIRSFLGRVSPSGSSSSRTTTSTAPRSSSCSGCSRGSRSWAPSRAATPPLGRPASSRRPWC